MQIFSLIHLYLLFVSLALFYMEKSHATTIQHQQRPHQNYALMRRALTQFHTGRHRTNTAKNGFSGVYHMYGHLASVEWAASGSGRIRRIKNERKNCMYDDGIWFLYHRRQSLHYRHKEMKIFADTELHYFFFIVWNFCVSSLTCRALRESAYVSTQVVT